MAFIEVKVVNAALGNSIPLPSYATPGSAGLDLRACLESALTLEANECQMIPTGLAIYLKNPEWAALVLPRSGLGHKHGLILGNSVGLIDSDYQGELKISMWNRSDKAYTIEPGHRIAQLVIVPVYQAQFQIVEEFGHSARGASGFGSTGT